MNIGIYMYVYKYMLTLAFVITPYFNPNLLPLGKSNIVNISATMLG